MAKPVYIRVQSHRAFLTHTDVDAALELIFDTPGVDIKYLGIQARPPMYPTDWKVGDPQQFEIDFKTEILMFDGAIIKEDLEKLTLNDITKYSILQPFSIVEPGATTGNGNVSIAEAKAATKAAAATQAAAIAAAAAEAKGPNPAPITEAEYMQDNGINAPKQYSYSEEGNTAIFMTDKGGKKQWWRVKGNEKDVLAMVSAFDPPA